MVKPIIFLAGLVIALYAFVSGLNAQQLPPAKQAIEQQYTQERALGSQNPAPKNLSAPYPIVPQQPFETGILDDCSPPFSAEVVTITSCWQGIVNNGETQVYAGAETANPQQGVVIVITETGRGQSVVTPVQAGAVRIVAAQNNALTLVTADNTYAMMFGVGTQSFTSVSPVVSVPSSGNSCNGFYSGTFVGNVSLRDGQTCIFVAGGITGNVEATGGSLMLFSANVTGNIEIAGGTYIIGPSTSVAGSLEISNTAGGQICGAGIKRNIALSTNTGMVQIGASHSCSGNTIGGNLEVSNNTGSTAIFSNSVTGNIEVTGNTGPTQVYSNVAGKSLECEGNSLITGGMNTAQQKEGQCSGF